MVTRSILGRHINEHSIETCREPTFSPRCCVTTDMDHVVGVVCPGLTLWVLRPQLDLVEHWDVSKTEGGTGRIVFEFMPGHLGVCVLGEECRKRSAEALCTIVLSDLIKRCRSCGLPSHLDPGAMGGRRDICRWSRATAKAPQHKFIKSRDLLVPLEPMSHLREFVLVVRSGVCIFCQINVEALRVLGIIVVGCPKEFDGRGVMKEGMELWEVEVRPDLEVDKD